MNIYIPFTYIIGWSKHKRFYYGAKYAQGCQPKDLWESYFTSSEYVKSFREERGEPDIIKIHRIFSDKDSCVSFENEYLTKIDAKNHILFLNESNGGKNFNIKEVSKETKDKRKQTTFIKYGCEHATQSQEIKDKTKQTNLEKYGVEYVLQIPNIREKGKQTCLSNWGYEHSLQVPKIREKGKQTKIEKYGVEFPSKLNEMKQKVKLTKKEKYGNENFNNPDKNKKTCLEKYGCEHATQSQEIKDKTKQTNLEKYGVEYVLQIPNIREKGKQTCLEKYGYEFPNQVQEFKEKGKQTCLSNWGYEHSLQVPEIRERGKQTCLDKYGVDNYNKTDKLCCHCGELKNINHERQCKHNPNRNIWDRSGENNPKAKFYIIVSPSEEEFRISTKKNLKIFAKENNLVIKDFIAGNIIGWTITEIERGT